VTKVKLEGLALARFAAEPNLREQGEPHVAPPGLDLSDKLA